MEIALQLTKASKNTVKVKHLGWRNPIQTVKLKVLKILKDWEVPIIVSYENIK